MAAGRVRSVWSALIAVALVAGIAAASPVAAAGELPVPTSLTTTVGDGQIVVAWTIDPEPAPPTGYDAEVQIGPDGSWAPAGATIDVDARTLSAPDPMLGFDVDLPLRIRATGPEGAVGEWSEVYQLHIPGHPLPNSERFDVTSDATVVTHEALVDAGLTTWPNGQFGIIPAPDAPGSFDFYADQGDERDQAGNGEAPGYGVARGTLADPLQSVRATHAHIQGVKEPADFIGGGRVWQDPTDQSLVMFYQRKAYTAGSGLYATIGAARSTDGGATFSDLGVILRPERTFDPASTDYVGAVDAAPVVLGSDLYLYFGDTLASGSATGTSVARISLSDLRAAAAAGVAPEFTKWHDGSFSTPGLGGASTSVLAPELEGDGWGADVIFSSCRRELVMVANVAVGETTQVVMVASTDGLHWSAPATLYDSPTSYRIYNTLVPDDLAAGGVEGAHFSMLTVTFPGPNDFWSGATVDRVGLVDRVAEAEGCVVDPPTPTGVTSSVTDGQLVVSWEIDPAATAPVGYEVETQSGEDGSWVPVDLPVDVPARRVTAPDPMLLADVDIPLRVRSVDSFGRTSAWSETHLLHIPGHPLSDSERFDVVGESTILTHQQLVDAGMDTWPDGQFGILPSLSHPGTYDFYANQGDARGPDGQGPAPGIGHTRGTLANPLQQVVSDHAQIQGLKTPGDYVGGGRVYRDAASGVVVMLYHHERYTAGGTAYFSLGMARSTDGGATFTDLGLILTPGLTFDPQRAEYVGPGDGAFAVVDGFMYVYFTDRRADGVQVGTAVARASIADILDAAAQGEAPAFHKWHDGAFSAPGLGGDPSSIIDPRLGGEGWNADVIYSSCRREFVMVANVTLAGKMGVVLMTSADGIHWSDAKTLYDVPPQFRIYNTLIPDDLADGGVVRGSGLSMLTVTFPGPTDFWSGATVERVSLVDRVAEQEGCVSQLSVGPAATALEPDDGSTAGVYVQVRLSRPRAEPTVVSYWTEDGTATDLPTAPGGVSDYIRFGTPAVPRTVTIPAGVTSKVLAIPIRSDSAVEADETFRVHVAASGSDLLMGNQVSEVTVLDADARSDGGKPILLVTPLQTQSEGDEAPNGVVQAYVRLSKAASVPISVSYWTHDGTALAGTDYLAKGPYTLTFAPGTTSKTIDVAVLPGRTSDGDRTFEVRWSVVGTAPSEVVVLEGPGTVRLLDDEP